MREMGASPVPGGGRPSNGGNKRLIGKRLSGRERTANPPGVTPRKEPRWCFDHFGFPGAVQRLTRT